MAKRSDEQIEKRRIYNRLKKRRLWATDPEFRAKKRAYVERTKARRAELARLRYKRDPAKANAARAERRRKNAARENERQRENYAANRLARWEKIRAGRVRRNPVYGLQSIVDRFRRGELSHDEFDRLFSERVALATEGDVREQTGCGDSEV